MGFALSGIGLLVLFILLEIYRKVRTFFTDFLQCSSVPDGAQMAALACMNDSLELSILVLVLQAQDHPSSQSVKENMQITC